MAEHAPNTQAPAAPDAAAEHDHADDGSHEIAGIRVSMNPVPFTALLFFIFCVFIAVIAWIPTYGF